MLHPLTWTVTSWTYAVVYQDISFHRDLLRASDQCKVAVTKLDEGLRLSTQGMDDCGQVVVQNSASIVSLQKNLEEMRREIIEHVWRGPVFPTVQEANSHIALRPRPLSAAIQSGGPSYPEAPVVPSPGMPMPHRMDPSEAGIMTSFATLSVSDPVQWISKPGVAASSSYETGPYPSAMTTVNPFPGERSSEAPAFSSSPPIPKHSKPRKMTETHTANIHRLITPVDHPPTWVSSGTTEVRIAVEKSPNSARLEWANTWMPLTRDMRFLSGVGEDGRPEWNGVGNNGLAIYFRDANDARKFKLAVDSALSDLIPVPPYSPEQAEHGGSSSSTPWPAGPSTYT